MKTTTSTDLTALVIIPPQPLALTVDDAGAMLGLSKHTIRYYIRQGKIKPVRFGRRVSVPMLEVERLSREGIKNEPKEIVQ